MKQPLTYRVYYNASEPFFGNGLAILAMASPVAGTHIRCVSPNFAGFGGIRTRRGGNHSQAALATKDQTTKQIVNG